MNTLDQALLHPGLFHKSLLSSSHTCKLELFLTFIIIFVVIQCITLRRRTYSSPICWPVFGMLPWFLLAVKTDFHEMLTDILHNHSRTLTFKGPWFSNFDHVVTSDPSNVEHILKINYLNFPKGQFIHSVMNDFLGDSFFTADDQKWFSLRKILSAKLHLPEFNKMVMESSAELIHSRLLPILENFTKQSATFDLQDVLSRLSFDQNCVMAFGVDPAYLTNGLPMVQFATAFKKTVELTALRFYLPMFTWKLMKYFNLGWERELQKSVEQINEFADKAISTRKKELSGKSSDEKSRSNFLSLFLESKDANCFSDDFLRDNCFNVIFAGWVTSPIALSWFFWILYQNPIVEEKIYAEVCDIVGKKTNFEDSGGEDSRAIFRPEELKKMNYLQAAITESLRLYPPVPFNILEVQNDDQFPNGFELKKGTPVLYSMYAMGRMESVWGKDCRDFKPERWLRDGKFVTESQYKFPAFNAGQRNCLGRDLAYNLMKNIAAPIIYRYRVKVVENHPVVPKLSVNLNMKYGLKVTLSRRSESESSTNSSGIQDPSSG